MFFHVGYFFLIVDFNDLLASKDKHLRRGVKEVVKAIRKQENGFVY